MRVDLAPSGLPYPVPPVGRPLRVAFTGPAGPLGIGALDAPLDGVVSTALPFADGDDADALRAALRRFAPHVVVALQPWVLPARALQDVRAVTLGALTEPLGRRIGGGLPDRGDRAGEARGVDAGDFDRVLAFDPLVVTELAGVLPLWRAVPPPVADRHFAPVHDVRVRPGALFLGEPTPHREQMLAPTREARPDVLRVAAPGEDVEGIDIGVNLHASALLAFEPAAALHLAAGRLLVSEPLSPSHGLEHGIDYVPVGTPDGLAHVLDRLQRFPRMWHAIRVRGRQKAEHFRASQVWPRVLGDLLADVAAFGTERSS